MKKNLLFFALIIGVMMAVVSCSSTSYSLLNSNLYPGKDLKSYKTFSILPYDQLKLPPAISIYDVQNIQRAIANELSVRGFKEDQSGKGDMTVMTTLYTKTEVTTKDAIPGWAPVRPLGPTASMYRSYYDDAQIIDNVSKDGVLAVDLIDAKENAIIWDGAVSSVIDDLKSVKNPQEINKACDKLFSKFPIPVPATK